MRRNLVGDWTIDDIAMVCRAFGIDCVPLARGSHHDIVQVEPIPSAEGGGWIGRVPDLPGCMSDGDDVESLKANMADAIET